MPSEPKPMDPDRLAECRRTIEEIRSGDSVTLGVPIVFVRELLAAHDYEKARADAAEEMARRAKTGMCAGSPNCAGGRVSCECHAAKFEPSMLARAEQAERERDETRQALRWERERCDRLERERNDALLEGASAAEALQGRTLKAEHERDKARAEVAQLREQGQRDATSIGAYLAALARTYLAIAPDCPANPDGTGEWDIHDPISAATELRERAEESEAKVARLRARVRVEAEDVERAGVTRAHVKAWMRSKGWGPLTEDDYCWISAVAPDGKPVDLWKSDGGISLGATIRYISDHIDRPGLDILDEMAAMEVPDGE